MNKKERKWSNNKKNQLVIKWVKYQQEKLNNRKRNWKTQEKELNNTKSNKLVIKRIEQWQEELSNITWGIEQHNKKNPTT